MDFSQSTCSLERILPEQKGEYYITGAVTLAPITSDTSLKNACTTPIATVIPTSTLIIQVAHGHGKGCSASNTIPKPITFLINDRYEQAPAPSDTVGQQITVFASSRQGQATARTS
jgi:hypothetical protein